MGQEQTLRISPRISLALLQQIAEWQVFRFAGAQTAHLANRWSRGNADAPYQEDCPKRSEAVGCTQNHDGADIRSACDSSVSPGIYCEAPGQKFAAIAAFLFIDLRAENTREGATKGGSHGQVARLSSFAEFGPQN
jgi:hypothetical protein